MFRSVFRMVLLIDSVWCCQSASWLKLLINLVLDRQDFLLLDTPDLLRLTGLGKLRRRHRGICHLVFIDLNAGDCYLLELCDLGGHARSTVL